MQWTINGLDDLQTQSQLIEYCELFHTACWLVWVKRAEFSRSAPLAFAGRERQIQMPQWPPPAAAEEGLKSRAAGIGTAIAQHVEEEEKQRTVQAWQGPCACLSCAPAFCAQSLLLSLLHLCNIDKQLF
jgi:hypothetical protein